MKVLARTWSPPRTKQDRPSVSSEPPDTITSMKAPISQARPMLGSTLASGVISAPATAASPQPIPNVMGGYLEKGAKAVIDMQEELRNQALKLFSGFPYPAGAAGAANEEAKPRGKGKGGKKSRTRKAKTGDRP